MSASKSIRLAGLAALLFTLLLVAAAPASARSFVLRASGNPTGPGEVLAIGDFKPPANPTVRRAVRVFGDPTSRRGAGEACSIRWARFGLRIKFANFGGSIACGPRGLAQKAIITGDRRWRTAAGLHIGDSVARLRRLHPNAKRTPRGFRLVEGVLPFGRPVTYAVLGARVSGGQVTAFTLFVGAAGD